MAERGESGTRHNARHILRSSLTGHWPLTALQAQAAVDAWSDQEVSAFVERELPRVEKWDFTVRSDGSADADRLNVTLAEIAEQRDRFWPDFHPEDFCHRCGGRNVPSWFVAADLWNVALPPEADTYQGILCPGCFVTLYEQAAGRRLTWKLVPSSYGLFDIDGPADG